MAAAPKEPTPRRWYHHWLFVDDHAVQELIRQLDDTYDELRVATFLGRPRTRRSTAASRRHRDALEAQIELLEDRVSERLWEIRDANEGRLTIRKPVVSGPIRSSGRLPKWQPPKAE